MITDAYRGSWAPLLRQIGTVIRVLIRPPRNRFLLRQDSQSEFSGFLPQIEPFLRYCQRQVKPVIAELAVYVAPGGIVLHQSTKQNEVQLHDTRVGFGDPPRGHSSAKGESSVAIRQR
jgi:hypothetical protein